MRRYQIFLAVFFVISMFSSMVFADSKQQPMLRNAYDFAFTAIDGADLPLSRYRGQVMLIVNTASQCGFTKQYKDLEALYQRYKDQGFVVIGVPCNDFGGQEPASEAVIAEFARKEFGITFPLTQKYSVTGDAAHPFFTWAVAQEKGGFFFSAPRWNFHKFLIDRDGQVLQSFGSQAEPLSQEIVEAVEKALGSVVTPPL